MASEPYAVRLVAERGMRAPISESWLRRKPFCSARDVHIARESSRNSRSESKQGSLLGK
jgi:hypothetical protein